MWILQGEGTEKRWLRIEKCQFGTEKRWLTAVKRGLARSPTCEESDESAPLAAYTVEQYYQNLH